MIRTFGSHKPRLHPSAFIHEAAELIGDVRIGAQASVWPGCVLRGDVDGIRIGERSNIQDLTVEHCREGSPAVVGRGVTVGHGVILHGARIGDGCLIGMGAIVMECSVGRQSLIAAGAMVPKGMKIPPRSLVMGLPAKVVRKLNAEELGVLKRSEDSYVALSARHAASSRIVS